MNLWFLRVEMSQWRMLDARASGMLVGKLMTSYRGLEVENPWARRVVL